MDEIEKKKLKKPQEETTQVNLAQPSEPAT
jgi:hypothetical protein